MESIEKFRKGGFYMMSARAVRIEDGVYESTSPKRKIDMDRVSQIIQGDTPTKNQDDSVKDNESQEKQNTLTTTA